MSATKDDLFESHLEASQVLADALTSWQAARRRRDTAANALATAYVAGHSTEDLAEYVQAYTDAVAAVEHAGAVHADARDEYAQANAVYVRGGAR